MYIDKVAIHKLRWNIYMMHFLVHNFVGHKENGASIFWV